MTMNGPTEEDPNYIADCGFTTAQMQAQVDAYHTSITAFNEAVYANGGFTWFVFLGGLALALASPSKNVARGLLLARVLTPPLSQG